MTAVSRPQLANFNRRTIGAEKRHIDGDEHCRVIAEHVGPLKDDSDLSLSISVNPCRHDGTSDQ